MTKTLHTVVKKLPGGMKVDIEAEGFHLMLDEPERLGGTDEGMTPMHALLGAFGSCLTMTAYIVGPNFGVDIDHFHVVLEGDIDKSKHPGFSEIRYVLHFKTKTDETKVRAFAEKLEEYCPVGATLKNNVTLKNTAILIDG